MEIEPIAISLNGTEFLVDFWTGDRSRRSLAKATTRWPNAIRVEEIGV